MRHSVASACLCVALACSSAAPPAAPPEAPAANPEASATVPGEPPLYRELAAIPAPSGFVDVLPPSMRAVLDEHVAALSTEQQQLLMEGTDPVVATRPLLYVAAGGRDPSLVTLIFSTTAASNELVALSMNADGEHDLAGVSNALVERAALWVLHARAADVSASVEHKREHLQEVAFSAGVLGRQDVERLALLELDELYPDPAWTVALVRLDVQALAVTQAQKRLNEAALPTEAKAALERDIELAKAVASGTAPSEAAPSDPSQALTLSREMMSIGLTERAAEVLRPFADRAEGHLGLAAALARAITDASACPRVDGAAAANEYICQQVWSKELAKPELGRLSRAWRSGKGRDPEAIETYIGLSYVVPLMYGLSGRGEQATSASIRSSFDQIAQVAHEAAESERYFRGVALMAEALGIAMEAAVSADSPRVTLEPNVRRELVQRAEKLASELAEDPWGQAAVLGVASMVSREEPLATLVAPLQPRIARQYETTLGTLLLWDVLADGDEARYQDLHSWFGEVATNRDASSFERSKWLFLWAEAGAHLQPSTATYETVRKIAENLDDERVPLALRLRARIDRAGLLARTGDFAGGADILMPIVQGTPRGAVASHDEQELLIAATGYLAILRALASEGEVRQKHVAELEKLLLEVGRSKAAPPTLQMWLVMWRAEFDHLQRHAKCKGDAACERRVAKTRGADEGALADAIGARSAALLKRGIVPVGGVQLEFRYLGNGRLAPRLEVAPRFLLAHVPRL